MHDGQMPNSERVYMLARGLREDPPPTAKSEERMSCTSPPIKSISRCALPFVIALAVSPCSAFSQTPVCHPIQRGETATQLARRITGDGRNKYQPWFQIMDASSRFVPKSQYDRVRIGWRACVVKQTIERSSAPPVTQLAKNADPVIADGSPRPLVTGAIQPAMGDVDLTLMWLGAALLLPLFGWRFVDDYLARKKTVLLVMRHYAHRFVREFERPLIQQPAELPLRARLRLRPARGRVDILLAPGEGRRYPNLSDHRKNLEYDVVRIARLLGDESFVRDPLYMHAEWVVVPFRFNLGQKHTGVP